MNITRMLQYIIKEKERLANTLALFCPIQDLCQNGYFLVVITRRDGIAVHHTALGRGP